MNFITYRDAVSLYPSSTLLHQRSYFLPMTPRGWQASSAMPEMERDPRTTQSISLNVHRRPLYTSNQKREIGMDVQRHIGDRWSWMLTFDSGGCVVEPEEARDHNDRQESMRNTKWVMKFNRSVPKLHPLNVDPNCFGPYMD